VTGFDLEAFLPYQIAVLSDRLSDGFAAHYRDKYGISVAEWRVVAHLSQEDAVSVREVCRRVNMEKPKVSRAAKRLEAAGYVRKITSASDRRLVELSLTAKGRAMIEALAPVALEYEAEVLAAVGVDAKTLRALVSGLNTALNQR